MASRARGPLATPPKPSAQERSDQVFRAGIERNLEKWRLDRRAHDWERRVKQEVLDAGVTSAADGDEFGEAYDDNGRLINWAQMRENELRVRVGWLTKEVEGFDAMIAAAERELGLQPGAEPVPAEGSGGR